MTFLQSQNLRFYAMLAVVLIHATGKDEILFLKNHNFFSGEFFSVMLNQLSRFCVPIFVFLSGYSLSKKYSKEKFLPIAFLKDRFLKIGLPFLFISFLTLAVEKKISLELPLIENFKRYLLALSLEPADYHLYFFVIIWQCYFIFPLIYRFSNSLLLWIFYLPLFFLTYPGILFLPFLGIKALVFPTAFFVYWIFYFYGGIFFAKKEKQITNWFEKTSHIFWIFLVSLSFLIVLFEYISRSYVETEPGYYNHFNRLSVQIYSFVFLFSYLRNSPIEPKQTLWSKFSQSAVSLSFFIYIYHPWILRFMEKFFQSGMFLFILVFSFTYAVGLILHLVLPQNFSPIRLLLALPLQKK